MTNKIVINEDLAIEDIKNFLSNFVDGDIDVVSQYPKTLDAVMYGRLNFSEDLTPTYKLLQPINKGTEFEKNEITFKTRVLPSVGASLAKGIDLQKDQITYGLVVTAHIVGCAAYKELDLFSKKDFQLIQELAPVFM